MQNQGHEMGGHNPEEGNIRRRYLVVSRYQYNAKSGLVVGLAITHNHIDNNPFRFYVVDYPSHTNGDALLFQMLSYDFVARHEQVIGHVKDSTEFDNLLNQVQNIFLKEQRP
ncbi:type II toxin-antitoxin system PemK/MazF family toxin [Lactobacillus helveticus]|nr:type II toxin-antitoxin system PemK/MazF family toxin [Lactobacillus helveticus]